jgi:outer membrane protein assembly factor BamB
MKKTGICITLVLAILTLSSMTGVFAQDWPQWRGANRDGVVTGFSTPANWFEALTLKWKADVGFGDATPILSDDRIYSFTRQGAEEVVLCLDKESGEVLWREAYEATEVTGAAARHPGPRSTPAVAEGKIVTLGVGGVLSCLDASSGKLIWREDPYPGLVPMFFTAMSPMICEGKCIAQLGTAGNGAVMAYDLDTGEELWRWSEEGPEYASPVLLKVAGTKQIVTLTEKSMVGINLTDGKLLWKFPFPPQRRAYNAATPIVRGETVILTGAGRGTKAITIEKQGNDFVPMETWSNEALAVQFNTPVLKDDLLFGYSNMGNLFCLDAQSGQTAWVDTIKHDRGGFAALLDAGEIILALPSSAELIAIEPTAREYTELANIKVADTPTYAHPVMAGNRMYVKDEETLALWMIE